ncbi:MAG: energy transducer TonB [Myxococcota bacterium]
MRRYALATCAATVISFGLFFLMQWLVTHDEANLDLSDQVRVIDFVRLKRDSRLETRRRELPKRRPPQRQPSRPALDVSTAGAAPTAARVQIRRPSFDGSLRLAGGPQLGPAPSDTDTIPLVRINPIYPRRAAERRVEGWVIVEFTIDAQGGVKDARVINGEPRNVFERAALRAIGKWKYRPKIQDGKPVEAVGVRVKLTFELDDI